MKLNTEKARRNANESDALFALVLGFSILRDELKLGSSPVRTTIKSSYLAKGKSFLFCFEKRIEMKLFRYRKPSMKTALGITKAKRAVARATGIPTTKAGRKRKALNAVTGGAYGQAQRARAAVSRPIKRAKHPATCLGCIVWVLSVSVGICVLCLVLF